MKPFALAAIALGLLLPAALAADVSAPVGIADNGAFYTLTNGLVSTQVSKRSGGLLSLKYAGLEMLDAAAGHPAGYWSHDPARGRVAARVTIDPRANGGERGEISIRGISDGGPLGGGPGGGVAADIEIRYALGRGDTGIWTYSIFSHPTNYPATSVGEARFCVKLNDRVFDWMTVDANRNLEMITTYDWNHGTPMNAKEARRMNSGIYKGQVEHKYDYSANQFDVRAWGWSSTGKNVGLWFINPSVEYLSGGPTKFELSAHRDATFNTNAPNAPAPPALLNYWRSSHYGGSICNLAATDAWTKVVGPFLVYCNSGGDHGSLWRDALARADEEGKNWPYAWVQGVDYPHKDGRGSVSGKIILRDPQAPGLQMSNLLVGVTAPDYAPAVVPKNAPRRSARRGNSDGGYGGYGLAGGGDDEAVMTNQNFSAGGTNLNLSESIPTNAPGRDRSRGGGGDSNLPRVVTWQNDAKNYEFWVRANPDGSFSIPNVRPGNYWLHAIADGVLGEFVLTNVTVTAGKDLPLGDLAWQPARYGKQLWDIGIPNRTAAEFFKGDEYFHWGWYLKYPKLFPLDVNYTVGKSDFRKDWFFEEVPYNTATNNTTGRSRGDGTTWAVMFNLTNAPAGKATLRLALCGIGTRSLWAAMNGHYLGAVPGLAPNAVLNRDGIGGSWCERDLAFDAALMRAGTNTLELTVPPGPLASGIMYDYLRLELDEQKRP